MNRYFSFKLYLCGLKRVQNIGICMAIILLASCIIPIISWKDAYYNDTVFYSEIIPAGFMVILFAPLLTYRMFSFLNKRNSADFYHAIPQTRLCVYISFMAAALTWLMGTVVVSAAVGTLSWSLFTTRDVSLLLPLYNILNYSVLVVFMAGCTAVGSMIAGTVFTAGFTAIALMVLPLTVLSYVVSIAEEFAPATVFSPWLTGEKHIFARFILGDGYTPDISLLINAVAGIGLITLGALLYVKRHSETAGKSTSSKKIQFILRVVAGLPLTLLCVWSAMAFEGGVLPLLIMAIISFLLFEFISTKKAKNMITVLPSFIAVIVIAFAIWGIGYGLGEMSKTTYPKSAADIKSVTFEEGVPVTIKGSTISYYGTTNNSIVLNSIVQGITNDKPAWRELVSVEMSNGTHREYKAAFSAESAGNILAETAKVDESVMQELLCLPDESRICEENLTLWRVFSEEYDSLTDDQKLKILDANYSFYNKYEGSVVFYLKNDSYLSYNMIKDLLPKTYAAQNIYE